MEKLAFGTGPLEVKIGDKIAILSGLRWPVILRGVYEEIEQDYQEESAIWEILGICYIEGAMLGEAWSGEVEKISLV